MPCCSLTKNKQKTPKNKSSDQLSSITLSRWSVLLIAFATIYRPIGIGLEGYLSLFATIGANCVTHFPWTSIIAAASLSLHEFSRTFGYGTGHLSKNQICPASTSQGLMGHNFAQYLKAPANKIYGEIVKVCFACSNHALSWDPLSSYSESMLCVPPKYSYRSSNF